MAVNMLESKKMAVRWPSCILSEIFLTCIIVIWYQVLVYNIIHIGACISEIQVVMDVWMLGGHMDGQMDGAT